MKTKICLPVIKKNINEISETITRYDTFYDMFEVWIDYLEICDLDFIRQLQKSLGKKLIIVFRREHGAKIQMTLKDRYKILDILQNTQSFVDLDIENQKEELEFIKNQNLKINSILSFHDYEKTPRTSSLVKIIEKMEIYRPNIYKIATLCQSEKEALTLMHLLLDLKEQQKKAIVLGMGKHGKITRIFGALCGNEITFTPENSNEETAYGQLTRKELQTILSILNS